MLVWTAKWFPWPEIIRRRELAGECRATGGPTLWNDGMWGPQGLDVLPSADQRGCGRPGALGLDPGPSSLSGFRLAHGEGVSAGSSGRRTLWRSSECNEWVWHCPSVVGEVAKLEPGRR